MVHHVSCSFGPKTLTLETGRLARQADGAVLVSYGETRVLVTVCSAPEPKENIDFIPLTVEFAEKYYAAGKIPGSFMRREGRPTQEATLSARMIDRPIRPLIPEGYHHETQIVATVLSVDLEADVDVAASIGASAALHLSDIPFNGPTASCRMGRYQDQWIINPSWDLIHKSQLDLEILVTGTEGAVMMVEGGAREASEALVLEAVLGAHREIKKIVGLINQLRDRAGQPKRSFQGPSADATLDSQMEKHSRAAILEALCTREKGLRQTKISAARRAAISALSTLAPTADASLTKREESRIKSSFNQLEYRLMREMILQDRERIDGRQLSQVRPIQVEVGLLPRTHGSALFTRGETQVLSTVTLGTSEDEQIVDTMFQNSMRNFLLHYNFPPFSVGEVGRMGGQSRREIGHGALAERSVRALMKPHAEFPYTVRVVCETFESNGSSSMASVCSASMALMDAGVPYPSPVAGIAMGLIKEKDQLAILSDILGDEDHLGDMDFKVAGTQRGITGIQMDIKIDGVTGAIMEQALAQAREGRLHILQEMARGIQAPREELSAFAPRITTITVPLDKIREVIGSGGKVVKDIIAQTGCKIDINDDGRIHIASTDGDQAERAIKMIRDIIAEVEIGKVYKGIIKKIVEFGAFVGIMPNQDGLLHISEISHERVNQVHDHLKEGDEIEVKVIEVDKMGKIRLSRKVLITHPSALPVRQASTGPKLVIKPLSPAN